MNSIKSADSGKLPLSPAERVGIGSLLIAILLLFLDVRLSVIPLAGFILLCAAAPFFPRFGFYLPVISRGVSNKKAVALTFDDGPDPLVTPQVLQLLLKHQVKATFFVTGKKAADHPELIKEILLHGHSIGNHSYIHDNLVMFRRKKTIANEGVELRYYSVIYELLDDVKAVLSGMLAPEVREDILGTAEVRDVFRSPKFGQIAGSLVIELHSYSPGNWIKIIQLELIKAGLL